MSIICYQTAAECLKQLCVHVAGQRGEITMGRERGEGGSGRRHFVTVANQRSVSGLNEPKKYAICLLISVCVYVCVRVCMTVTVSMCECICMCMCVVEDICCSDLW